MSDQLERKLENLGIIALLLVALTLAFVGGAHGWYSYPFLLVGTAGLHAFRLNYAWRLEKALSGGRKMDQDLFRKWPAFSGLPYPASMPPKETPLMWAFFRASRANRFYYPCLGALAIGYFLNGGLGNGQWALDGLSLYLVAYALDGLYFLRAQVTYFRAVTEKPEAPFEAELPPRPYVAIEEPMAKLGMLTAMAGFLMALIIPLVTVQALAAASGIAAAILFRQSWGTMNGLRLDLQGLDEWVQMWQLEQPRKGAL